MLVPLEQKQVEVVVFLGEEVAEDTSGISTADLIGRQAEVNALDKVPELGHEVLIELPKQKREKNMIESDKQNRNTTEMYFT